VSVDAFLEHAQRAGWDVLPRGGGHTDADVEERAPEDLRAFLERCGGVRCGAGVSVGTRVVSAQEEILGEREESDPSAGWYVIAEDSEEATAERVVIDLNEDRRGRCYEAFWDRFGIPDSMPVVARSFTEFLDRLRASDGAPYWSGAELGIGDAYD
jgi:hypothetical protein